MEGWQEDAGQSTLETRGEECLVEDEVELEGEDLVGETRWGNAGQILHGYENVRASVREMTKGWEVLLLLVSVNLFHSHGLTMGLYNKTAGLHWITLMLGTCCGGSEA